MTLFDRTLVALWALLLLSICCVGAQREPTLKQALEATIVTSDVAYGMAVELCDKRERAVIQRTPSTLEQDKEELARIREVCDRIFKVFEDTRRVNLLVSELEML